MIGCRTLLVLFLVSGPVSAARAESPVARFTLRDHLRRQWQHELVFFAVAPGIHGRQDVRLLGPDGKEVVCQWVPAEHSPSGEPSIAFLASLAELGSSTYRLVPGRPSTATDLRVRADADSATLENRQTGIRLGGREAVADGPIGGIRLRSGRWVGGGKLATPLKPERCKVELLTSGPVFADVRVAYGFPKYCFWRMKFRVIAGEPVVLVDEEFVLPEGSVYRFELAKGWSPEEMFYRDNGNRCQLVKIASLPGPAAFLWRAWPTWWNSTPEAQWTAFCQGDDLLMLGAYDAGVWIEPGRTEWETAVPIAKDTLSATMQLQGFRRRWMLGTLKKSESLPEKEGALVAPPAQQFLIRHGDVPLDRVKDYVVEWDDRGAARPGLFLTPAELAHFRKRFKVDPKTLEPLRGKAVFPYQMDDHVAYFLATGDKQLGRRLAEKALELAQSAVDGLVRQDKLRNQGSCPHHRIREVMWCAILSDLALSPGILQPDERARLRAQLAFLGYTLGDPAFHSRARGYCANPNMTTMARSMHGLVACAIPRHPQAKTWARAAIEEVDRELTEWCGSGGGWLEAPHYMTASVDSLVSIALAVRGKGFTEVAWHEHPKLKLTLAWLAKISTPPDPRLGGDRHMPAIGNTYLGERTCLPGWAAWLWRDKDPAFAQQMQWVYRAHGSPRTPGIGGAYPGLQGYEHVLLDPAIPARAPKFTSELFPDAGAVLRAHFPGDRETYLHYIQGPMHQHYDFDEGSIVFWGKGRPLCEDFGYYGRAPASDHSRIDDGFYEALGVEGRIEEFATGTVDYLRGERAGWHRQVLLVKDPDPLGPNYAVLRDVVLSNRQAQWRVWIATDQPPPVDRNPVRAKGRDDVDLVVFFADPAGPAMRTEEITRTAGASGFAGRDSTQRSLQIAMPAQQPVTAVLYPVMRDQPTPKFTVLGGGRVVKIESPQGTDVVMLALERFAYRGEGIEFDGKAGVVQIRPAGPRLSLPCAGKLRCRGKTFENRKASGRTMSRQ